MTDALITQVLTHLASIIEQQIKVEFRLVVGVNREIRKLKSTLEAVQAVLVDAEKRQVKEETVNVWLGKLEDVSYDMDDVLAEWSTAILKIQIEGVDKNTQNKVCCFFILPLPCSCFSRVVQRRDIALKIKGITERLDLIAIEKDRYKFHSAIIAGEEPQLRHKSTSFLDESDVFGRNEDKITLLSNLCSESSFVGQNILPIISIVGMGGIGKTTLAQLAYNSDEVKGYFETRLWVCVSEPFDEVRVAKAIVEEAEGTAPNVVELQTTLRYVRKSIEGKKFLLVLDDVWTDDYRMWEPFKYTLKNGAPGSKVLVTARNERVAKMMESTYTLQLGQLSNQDCWSLFCRIAFFEISMEDYEKLEDIGRKISDKCKGLPLATKTIGSLMRLKTTVDDWRSVLESEIWELEGAKKGLFPPLLLSYYDLPSAMRRCFVYCANFPKDYKIEAENLIKLWMAQGYLNTKRSAEMEVTGREYLDALIMRSFFQDLEKDGDNVIRFKMHDMFHDFAQSVTKNECLVVKANSGTEGRMYSASENLRHLTLVRGDENSFPDLCGNTERLHTFWVQSFYDSPPIVSEVDQIPPLLFHRMKRLKALDLSHNRFRKIPKEIGEMMNLRYLNLSYNPLEELPESVCDFYNLQTLKLLACNHLVKLPLGMGKLINLRHLEIGGTDSLRRMPKGIRGLSALRTLSKFVINGGGDTTEASCKLGDLRNLNYLRGSLEIEGLGYEENAVEAEEAELKNKEHLLKLHMTFNPLVQAEGITAVAEALQPHTSLVWLQIKLYGGTQFPRWMTLLTHLKKLRLVECQDCLFLPPLGKLPSLESLHLESMHNLRSVNHEFWGLEIDDIGRVGGSASVFIPFPKLKKFKIAYMRSWERWEMIKTGSEEDEDSIRIMPCLHYLKLSHCEQLKMLPDYLLQMTPLRRLRICNCPILKQRYERDIGEDWRKISHISKTNIS